MIIKRKNGNYQVRMRDSAGQWISEIFQTKKEAEAYETQQKQRRNSGDFVSNAAKHITFDEYFKEWFIAVKHQATGGWRKNQQSCYTRHVKDVLGSCSLNSIKPNQVADVLNRMEDKGLSKQTCLHVYSMLRKCFSDAVEIFNLLHKSPVHRSCRPKVPRKEARFLSLAQIRLLLVQAENNPYEIAIWLGIFMGLRVGEVQALKWEDVDFESGILRIRRNYARHDGIERDYPKGRKQHSHRIPQELLQKLRMARKVATSDYVACPPNWKRLDYWKYRKELVSLCSALGLHNVATHALRHSSSELWMEHGASRDDLRMLFAHSCSSTTDRYVHDRGSRLEKVAQVIRLFPGGSPNDPQIRISKKK